MDEYVRTDVFGEFIKRCEDENKRQNNRLEKLEDEIEVIHELTESVVKMAVNMEHMAAEQRKTNERLEIIENRDGEKWRTVITHVITLITGAIIAYALTKIGLGGV